MPAGTWRVQRRRRTLGGSGGAGAGGQAPGLAARPAWLSAAPLAHPAPLCPRTCAGEGPLAGGAGGRCRPRAPCAPVLLRCEPASLLGPGGRPSGCRGARRAEVLRARTLVRGAGRFEFLGQKGREFAGLWGAASRMLACCAAPWFLVSPRHLANSGCVIPTTALCARPPVTGEEQAGLAPAYRHRVVLHLVCLRALAPPRCSATATR